MATSQINQVIRHVRRALLLQDGAALTDGQLLGQFIEHRDEAAFAALVRRHGPMVWGVCRRVLSNQHDAEDAFQATFLVLIRKAACVLPREMVVNWLYGVAHQTALKAKATAARRRVRERQVTVMPEAKAVDEDLWCDLQPLLDQELSRLPEKYRVPIVLCDLEGKTRRQAARHVGVPDGTLAARLARGRVMLAKRLSRHGVGVSGGVLAAVLAQNAASAGLPASVVSSTLKATSWFAAGQAAATGLISAQVAALTEGVVKTMLLAKLKIATTILLVVAVSGAGGLLFQTHAAGRAFASNELSAQSVDDPFVPADSPEQEQKSNDGVREEAIKALVQFAASEQKAERELAIKALAEFSRQVKAADLTRQRDAAVAGLFKYRVPIETGLTESKEGGRIEIRQIWGTRPRIEVGGQYLVRGKYVLPPGERGMLYFYATAGGAWGAITTTLDLQSTALDKQEGEFTLVHGMSGPGYFHLYLADPERYSRYFANVYFGTGDNVWGKKP